MDASTPGARSGVLTWPVGILDDDGKRSVTRRSEQTKFSPVLDPDRTEPDAPAEMEEAATEEADGDAMAEPKDSQNPGGGGVNFRRVASRLQQIPEDVQHPADYPGSSARPLNRWGTLRKTETFTAEMRKRIDAHRGLENEKLGKQLEDKRAELARIRASSAPLSSSCFPSFSFSKPR